MHFSPEKSCTRREFLRLGSYGMLGLSLPVLSAWETTSGNTKSPSARKPGFGRAKSVIFLFLQGGPSHIDIWDPKPGAPIEIRSRFQPIKTNVAGIELTEVMPRLARQMDKVTLVRSVSYTPAGIFDHAAAIHETLTGAPPELFLPSGRIEQTEFSPVRSFMLPFLVLPTSAASVTPDLTSESPALRDAYGRNSFGQNVLQARRLVERGNHFVQVNWPADTGLDSWDTHTDNFASLDRSLCPKLDGALATLLEDLDQRGLLEETLVLAMGEFGRSPRLGVSSSGRHNTADGRDHWPYCFTALLAGGPIAHGRVYGASDATGSFPAEDPVHPRDLVATIHHCLGMRSPTSPTTGRLVEGVLG